MVALLSLLNSCTLAQWGHLGQQQSGNIEAKSPTASWPGRHSFLTYFTMKSTCYILETMTVAQNLRYAPRMLSTTLFATLLIVAAGQAQTPDKAKLDQFLDRLAEKNKGMGGLTLAKDGNVLYTHSFGYSQISGNEKKPLTAETKYRIASITKMYTAVMIFQLVEEGKLKLTDTLDKFFPQIPNANRITIAHILAHRSGIHDSLIDKDLRPGPKTEPITKEQ